jgi:hypothetical protein
MTPSPPNRQTKLCCLKKSQLFIEFAVICLNNLMLSAQSYLFYLKYSFAALWALLPGVAAPSPPQSLS